MSWLYIFLASLVEGLTEFLPISSTGHLIILNHLLQIKSSPLISSFDIFIQLGAILAIVDLYLKELLQNKKQIFNLLISFFPTAIIGLLFYPLVKGFLFDNIAVLVIALTLGGILIFFLPRVKSSKKQLSYFEYFKIGLFQSLSIIPGTSRALMTIAGGLYSGLDLAESIKYSFLLAIPTIGAATTLDLFKSRHVLLQSPQYFIYFLIGFVLSYLSAKFSVKFFLNLVKSKGLKPFAYYRIILAIIIFCLFILPLWKPF